MTRPRLHRPPTGLIRASAVAGALLLSACSGAPSASSGQPTTTTAAIASVPTSDDAAHSELHGHDELHDDDEMHEHIEVPLEAPPTWDETAQADAAAAATTAVATWTSGGTDGGWWSSLAPLLSPVAQGAYAGTDPANVPGRQVAGPPSLAADPGSAYLARVVVPTDAGDYEVLLSRTGADAPWLVERFQLPQEGPRP